MCRALYTLHTTQVDSKTDSARWAQRTLGERWAPLIERALAWPQGAQADEFDETLAFMRTVLKEG
jgi:hypothetical protein